jgi:hypothetical protein
MSWLATLAFPRNTADRGGGTGIVRPRLSVQPVFTEIVWFVEKLFLKFDFAIAEQQRLAVKALGPQPGRLPPLG